MTEPTEPIRKGLLPCIPPPEWEFHTVCGARTGTDGVALFPGDTGPVVVRRRVSYGDWEPVRPDRWAPEPPTDARAVSAGVAPATDQTTLRDRIADAVKRTLPMSSGLACEVVAEAVLAVLPAPPTDQATVRCGSCEHEAQYHDVDGRCWFTVEQGVTGRDAVCSCQLRRVAAESAPADTGHDDARCPEHEPLVGGQCSKEAGHEGPHSDRPGRIWYPVDDVPAADPQPVSDEFLQRLATVKVREDATVDPAMCPRCKGDNSEAFQLCARCATEQPAAAQQPKEA